MNTEIEKKLTQNYEIPQEDWNLIKTIAQRVGDDFEMEVSLGQPYYTQLNPTTGEEERFSYRAYIDTIERKVVFNPLFVKENPKEAQIAAAHEGAHRAISRNVAEIGLSQKQIDKILSSEYLGFSSFENIGLEDPRVNFYSVKKFPGLEKLNREHFNEMLKKEKTSFILVPELEFIASKLGIYPRYGQAASELLRFWHQGKYSEKLDPDVENFLKLKQEFATKYQNNIPSTKGKLTEEDVTRKAQECFSIYHEDIWPELKKLIKMDLNTEQNKQVIQQFIQKQKDLEKKKKELGQNQGDGKKQLQKEMTEIEKSLEPFNELPKDVKEELIEQICVATQNEIENLNKGIGFKKEEMKRIEQIQAELDGDIKSLNQKEKKSLGQNKEDLARQIQEAEGAKLMQEMQMKKKKKELNDMQNRLERITQGKEVHYLESELSEKTKRKIDELFKKLPKGKREEIRQKAREKLEDFEDALNEEIEAKLDKDGKESHKSRRIRKKAALDSIEAKDAMDRVREELRRKHEKGMNTYEKTRKDVAGLIESLYFRLRQILKPEEYGGEQAGYPAGRLLDINRAMQSQKDVEQKNKLWFRETEPQRKDYRFWHLLDLSGSMEGRPIKEVLRGFVVAAEAIDKIENLNSEAVTIYQGITGFHGRIFPYKIFRQSLSEEIKKRISTITERTKDRDATTNTYQGTLRALNYLKQNLGESGNFLLTFTDAEPNHDVRKELKNLLKNGKEERERLKIKVGLVWLLETKAETELEALVKEYGYDFGLVLFAVKSVRKGEKNFAENLSDLLEDIIRNPRKY